MFLVIFHKKAYILFILVGRSLCYNEAYIPTKHHLEDSMDQIRKTTVLAERTIHTARLCLRYRLECDNGFWISVAGEKELARVPLGSDLEAAWSLFCSCVRGSVTPCSLEEICEDFFFLQSARQSG